MALRANDPYANRTWLDFIGDMRANAKENKDPLAPRPVDAPVAASGPEERASIRGMRLAPASAAAPAPLVAQPVATEAPATSLRLMSGRLGETDQQMPLDTGAAPGTGFILDQSTGRKVWFDGQNIGMNRPRTGQPFTAQPQGLRQTAGARGQYNFEGTAADADKFFAPVYNTSRMTVAGTSGGGVPTVPASSVASEPMGDTFEGLLVQGLRTRRDRTYANIANQEQQAALTARGQDVTMRGQDFTAADATGLRAQAAERDAALNAQTGAQRALYQTQADQAKAETDLFNRYQAETNPTAKAQLREEYQLLTGKSREQAAKVHLGELDEMTSEGIRQVPYASVVDPSAPGGLRVLRGGADLAGAVSPLQAELGALTPEQQTALRTSFGNWKDVTPEEIRAKIAEMRKK